MDYQIPALFSLRDFMRFTYVCVCVCPSSLLINSHSVMTPSGQIAPGDHSARDSALWSLHQHGPLQAHARTSWPVEEENDVALTRRTRMG